MKKYWIILHRYVYDFSDDFGGIDVNDVLDIYKYLMKKSWYKTVFGLIRKCLLHFSVFAQ